MKKFPLLKEQKANGYGRDKQEKNWESRNIFVVVLILHSNNFLCATNTPHGYFAASLAFENFLLATAAASLPCSVCLFLFSFFHSSILVCSTFSTVLYVYYFLYVLLLLLFDIRHPHSLLQWLDGFRSSEKTLCGLAPCKKWNCKVFL